MLTAIKLNRETQCGTVEIKHIRAGRVLPTEIDPELLVPQSLPGTQFNVGRVAS
jgi:hypothetical protein